MEVKIYREPENETLIFNEGHLEEYNKLALELGLTTQEKVDNSNVPNVYLCLNEAMQKQLKAICPCGSKIEDYKKTTIPLEVLKVYKFTKENEMFDGYTVLYNDIEPDPMLIGWKWQNENAKSKGYNWQVDRFLIARWGDCAMEIEELLALGFEKLKLEIQDKAIAALEKCNSVLKNPDVYVRKLLKNETSDLSIDLHTSANSNPF